MIGPNHYKAKLGRGWAGQAFSFFAQVITYPPAQLASKVVQPYHAAHNLKLRFFSIKFCKYNTLKYYAVN